MNVKRNKILCNPKSTDKIFFIDDGKLYSAYKYKKQSDKGVDVKDCTLRKHGLIEEMFLKEVINKSVFWKDEDFCEGDN